MSGIVVNNAILLVHRTLQTIKNNKLNINDAILDATISRIRPIFMSTLTSIFGMLPLVIFPGAGSELYKGLGSVILGRFEPFCNLNFIDCSANAEIIILHLKAIKPDFFNMFTNLYFDL